MPARTCQRTRRRKAASSRSPSGVNGVTSAVKAPRRAGRAGCVSGSVIGRSFQAAMGSRASSSSTTGSKAWRPGSRGATSQPVGGGEDPGGVGGAVTGRQAELDRLARGIEPDQVHPRRRPGPDRDDLEVVRRARGADARRRSAGRDRSRCRTAGRAWSGGAIRARYGSNASSGPNSPTAASTSRPNSATPMLKFEAATAAAPCSRRSASTVGAVRRPAGRRDDEPPAAGVEGGGQVRRRRRRRARPRRSRSAPTRSSGRCRPGDRSAQDADVRRRGRARRSRRPGRAGRRRG